MFDPNDRDQMVALQQSIQRGKAATASKQSVGEKLFSGLELFRNQAVLWRGMIAGMNPQWSSEQVDVEVQRRLKIKERLDDAGLYVSELPTRPSS